MTGRRRHNFSLNPGKSSMKYQWRRGEGFTLHYEISYATSQPRENAFSRNSEILFQQSALQQDF